MSVLWRLILILVPSCCMIETAVLESPTNVGTQSKNNVAVVLQPSTNISPKSDNEADAEAHENKFKRIITPAPTSHNHVLASGLMSQTPFHLPKSETARKSNRLEYQAKGFRSFPSGVSPVKVSTRHLPDSISSLNKRRGLHKHPRRSESSTHNTTNSHTDNENYFIAKTLKRSKHGSSSFVSGINLSPTVRTMSPDNSESISARTASDKLSTHFQGDQTARFNTTFTPTLNTTFTRTLNTTFTPTLNTTFTPTLNTTFTPTLNTTFTPTLNTTFTPTLNTTFTPTLNTTFTPTLNTTFTPTLNTTFTRTLNTTHTPTPSKTPHRLQQIKINALVNNLHTEKRCTCESTICDFSFCQLSTVPKDLPTSITELNLNSNFIKGLLVNGFSRNRLLEVLILSNNLLSVLKDGSFNGLTRLRYLDISYNLLQREVPLPRTVFEPLKSLKVLHMEVNAEKCPSIPVDVDVVLSYLKNVEELYFDNYIDPDLDIGFGPGFRNISSLRKLTINCGVCRFDSLKNSTFINLGHITSLDVSDCGLYALFIEAGTLSPLTSLETLNISRNENLGTDDLPSLMWGLQSSNIQTLIMNYIVNDQEYTTIDITLADCLPKTLTTLSAWGNNILFIDYNAVQYLPKSLRAIDIRGNNILTNPDDIALEELVNLETLLINTLTEGCAVDSNLKTFHEQPKCLSRNCLLRSKTQMISTENLNARLPWSLKRVQISVEDMHSDYLLHIEDRNNLQEIDLGCSYLPEFDFRSFDRLPNLRSINVRRSSVRMFIPPFNDIISLETLILEGNLLNDFLNSFGSPFYNLGGLLYLDLSFNQLKSVPRDLFSGLENVEHIRLDGNSFSVFDADMTNVTALKMLNLSNTELPQLPSETREHIDQLCKARPGQIRVDMADCPIQCDCFNLDFLKWMVSSPAFDRSFTGYKCRFSDTSIKYIVDGYQGTIRVLERECAKNFPMFLIVLAATSFLLCVVVGAIVYRFRWKIRYLYYAAYLKVMDKHKNDNQHEFVYDVFLSFDSEDQVFVTRQLSPELEKRGLKLLIHTRDFVAGTYIASNIVMAVAESRKTMVVLTRNLLESDWCNYELQMATMEAVHTGRQVLLFLLKENIPSRELDVDLLRHIRNNTYVPYPEPEDEGDEEKMERFYDKLAHDLQR